MKNFFKNFIPSKSKIVRYFIAPNENGSCSLYSKHEFMNSKKAGYNKEIFKGSEETCENKLTQLNKQLTVNKLKGL